MCVISSPRTSTMGRQPRNGMDGVANAKEEDKERIPVPYQKKKRERIPVPGGGFRKD